MNGSFIVYGELSELFAIYYFTMLKSLNPSNYMRYFYLVFLVIFEQAPQNVQDEYILLNNKQLLLFTLHSIHNKIERLILLLVCGLT